jgi:hypothetical protein
MVVGVLLGLPIGWLLGILILLPFMLGLFFDMLLGLLVGAALYRVASPAAPVRRPVAVAIGLAVTLLVWCTSLAGEYYNVRGYSIYGYGSQGLAWYPVDGDVTRSVRRWFADRSFKPEQVAALRSETRNAFLQELDSKYPPGGFIGFVRWSVVTDKPIQIPRIFSPSVETCRPPQRGAIWLFRLALSLILLAGAILSQVLGLAAPTITGAPPISNPPAPPPPPAEAP